MAKYTFKNGEEEQPTPDVIAPEETPAPVQDAPAVPVDTTVAEAPAAPAPGTYIGPKYKYGIIIPDTTEQVNPKLMSPEERDSLIARYPPAGAWWA